MARTCEAYAKGDGRDWRIITLETLHRMLDTALVYEFKRRLSKRHLERPMEVAKRTPTRSASSAILMASARWASILAVTRRTRHAASFHVTTLARTCADVLAWISTERNWPNAGRR
jgi:hypothetical protein